MTSPQATASTTLLGHEVKEAGKGPPSFGSVPPSTSASGGTDELDGAESSSNDAFEFLDFHEKSGEVSDVELFSDLTVVVSIHMLSDLLTDGDEEGEEDNVWWWFLIRVFYVYTLWLQYMEVANLHNLFSTMTKRVDVIYYIIIFGFMTILVFLSKACQKDQHRHVAIIYLLGRLWGVVVVRLEALSPRAASMDPHQYEFLRKYTLLYPKYFLCECAPLVLALLFSLEHDNDNILLWGGIAMMVLRNVMRIVIGLKCDLSNSYDDWDGKLCNTDHTKERYKLITLIFLGELCFSSTSVPGNYYTSLSALVTAMGCFLCYFLPRVEGRVEAWNRSALCNLQCHTSHFVIFCALPIMGVGFVEMMKENEEGNKVDDEETDDEERRWYNSPHAILSISAGFFLLSLGTIEMMTKDPEIPEQRVQMKRRLRVLLYLAMGVVLVGIQFLSKAAATYVPLVIVGTGLTLIWGVQVSV